MLYLNNTIQTELSFQATENISDNYQLELVIEKGGEEIYSKVYALAYGLYPTTEWQTNQEITSSYNFVIPKQFPLDEHKIKLHLVAVESGDVAIIGINSIGVTNLVVKRLGSEIVLN